MWRGVHCRWLAHGGMEIFLKSHKLARRLQTGPEVSDMPRRGHEQASNPTARRLTHLRAARLEKRQRSVCHLRCAGPLSSSRPPRHSARLAALRPAGACCRAGPASRQAGWEQSKGSTAGCKVQLGAFPVSLVGKVGGAAYRRLYCPWPQDLPKGCSCLLASLAASPHLQLPASPVRQTTHGTNHCQITMHKLAMPKKTCTLATYKPEESSAPAVYHSCAAAAGIAAHLPLTMRNRFATPRRSGCKTVLRTCSAPPGCAAAAGTAPHRQPACWRAPRPTQ